MFEFDTMATIDIILLAVTAIFVLIWGISGFGKQCTKLISFLALNFLSVALVALLLPRLLAWEPIGTQGVQWVSSLVPVSSEPYANAEELSSVLQNLGVPEALCAYLAPCILAIAPNATDLSTALGTVLLSVIGGILLFILVYLLLKLLIRLLEGLVKAIRKVSVLKALDHLLGIAGGVLVSFVLVSALLALIGLIPAETIPQIESVRSFIAQGEMTAYLYNHNFIGDLLAQVLQVTIAALPA